MYLNSSLLGAMLLLIFEMADPVYSEVFPFLETSEDESIVLNDNLNCDIILSDDDRYQKCDNLNLNPFTYTE